MLGLLRVDGALGFGLVFIYWFHVILSYDLGMESLVLYSNFNCDEAK